MNRFYAVLVVLILVGSTVAPALSQQTRAESEGVWSEADRCAKLAVQLFPDYTPQGNAARENYRRACLRAHNLPAPNGQVRASDWSTK